MSLGQHMIYSWGNMKSIFLKKYQDFCKSRDINDILRMQQIEDENLEEYLEWFLYNFHKSRGSILDEKIIRTVFLKGLRDDCIETLILIIGGDIYKKPFAEVSRSQAKVGKKLRELRENFRDYVQKKTMANVVTRVELGNLLEKFKTDILNTISD